MERTKNYYDIRKWVETVISSCTTFQHYLVANKVLYNFKKQEVDSDLARRFDDFCDLKVALLKRLMEINRTPKDD